MKKISIKKILLIVLTSSVIFYVFNPKEEALFMIFGILLLLFFRNVFYLMVSPAVLYVERERLLKKISLSATKHIELSEDKEIILKFYEFLNKVSNRVIGENILLILLLVLILNGYYYEFGKSYFIFTFPFIWMLYYIDAK